MSENKNGKCVSYMLKNDDRIHVSREWPGDEPNYIPVTPNEIKISNLLFSIEDDLINTFHSKQAKVTVMLDVEAAEAEKHKKPMKLQTTISSRWYE